MSLTIKCTVASVLSIFVTQLALASSNFSMQNTEMTVNDSVNVQAPIKNLSGGTCWLKVDSDFSIPGSDNKYAVKIFSSQSPGLVRIRDSELEKRFAKSEAADPKHLLHYTPYREKEFAPPMGADLVKLPGSKVNLMSRVPFSIAHGGVMDLLLKLPFQEEVKVSFLLQTEGNKYRTFLIDESGQHILFDSIYIEAKTLFGKPNILRGIEKVSFLLNGKTVSEMSDL